jgi:hypothetical protein
MGMEKMSANQRQHQNREAIAVEDTAILILSCDKYSDAWEPFFFFFFKFWPNCPFPKFLSANKLTYPDSRVSTIHFENDKSDWSTTFLWALDQIPAQNVIVLLEDYFLSAPAQEGAIVELIQYARRKGAGYLRWVPIPPPDDPCPDQPLLGEIRKGSRYRSSSQAAWWRKRTLQSVLKAGESPWEFEMKGPARSCLLDEPFLSLRENVGYPFDYYTTAIRKGKWEPGAVAMCNQYGVRLDLNRRPVMTRYDLWQRSINRTIKHPIAQFVRRILRTPRS